MRSRMPWIGLALLSNLVLAGSASAGIIQPYLRAGYGGGQLRMQAINDGIQSDQSAIRAIPGVSASFQNVGPGFGPTVSAGLWLLPDFRVGATYSYSYSKRENRVHSPFVFYDDLMKFRMSEVGVEAALRVVRLSGLCVGGRVSQARADASQGYSLEQFSGNYYVDATARRTRTTYGVFLGFDQTNEAGVAGFLLFGYQFRDMGGMPSQGVVSDGVNSAPFTGTTVEMDYSGFYAQVGVGFDAPR